jgi:hypothetical protein
MNVLLPPSFLITSVISCALHSSPCPTMKSEKVSVHVPAAMGTLGLVRALALTPSPLSQHRAPPPLSQHRAPTRTEREGPQQCAQPLEVLLQHCLERLKIRSLAQQRCGRRAVLQVQGVQLQLERVVASHRLCT